MPARNSASSVAASQPQSTTTPSDTDVQWRRLVDTLTRIRGLSAASRAIQHFSQDGDEIFGVDIGDAALAISETLHELCDAADETALGLIFSAHPDMHDPEVVAAARRQGVLRPHR